MAGSKPCVYLIDASIYIFRAYFSVPDTLTNEAGHTINALHGFAGTLAGFLEQEKPAHVGVVFDESLTTSFRNDIYPDYKANRETPPEELKQQFGFCRELVRGLGLAEFASDAFEADDLIGTLATGLREQGFSIVILTADKDLAQLVGEHDMLWDYARNRRHRYEDIPGWLGVRAEQVADWLALTGDSVDNIPGVPGIGAKTAAALLAEFESLDDIFDNLDRVSDLKIRGAKRVQNLLGEHREAAELARQLTGIAIDKDMSVHADVVARQAVSADDVRAVCEKLGLGRMTAAKLARLAG